MANIRIAVVGVGNCASSLIQGIGYYGAYEKSGQEEPAAGLMHPRLGGYGVADIEVVAAFDVDRRKVGRPVEDAIFAPPNNTKIFYKGVARSGVKVMMGPVMDGIPGHMAEYEVGRRFEAAGEKAVDVAEVLRESGAEILVNYLPVGAQKATEHYVQACLEAGVSLVNCIPVFIVSDERWAGEFRRRGIPCVGDDVKAQVGATITHRTLMRMMAQRGMKIDSTYQLNVGGNTDFLNMLARERLVSKKISKTEAVTSQLEEGLEADQIHVGPSDYVSFLKDNKVCFLRVEATGFGGVAMNLELRLSVEDSPNSAGVVVDAIRCCKLARERGVGGPIEAVSAYTMKHPPIQMADEAARVALEEFVESGPRAGVV